MKKPWPKAIAAVLTAAVAACALWAGFRMLQKDYVIWNGALFSRQERQLDVSGRKMRNLEAFLGFEELQLLDARNTGMTVEQYEWFRREIPGCRVLWEVPIQGHTYSLDTVQLSAQALTEEEMDSLQYLPALGLVDLGDWEDASAIRQLKTDYPGIQVRHRIQVAGEWWDSDVRSLALRDARAEELKEKLSLFDQLESVLLTGKIPSLEEMEALKAQYPQVFFLWKIQALGMELETDLETLDLPDGSLDSVAQLEELLPWFPHLKTLRLSSLGLPGDQLLALAKKYPDIHFLFDLPFGDHLLSTDAGEIDISGMPLTDTAQLEEILPCFRDLKKVVMCGCGISNEEMDELNRKYENIRFVWSVELAGKTFRTDAVHFTPNRWGLKCTNENIADLQYCQDMVCVDIGHAFRVTNCDWVKNMPELKYLVLAETGISDLTPLEGHEKLIFLELFLSKVKDLTPLTTCKALEDLNLCYTYGDPEPIGQMTWLKRLWWSGRWIARKKLPDKLTDTELDFGAGSSTGRGWREGQHYYDMRDFIGMEYMTG